MNDTYFIRIAMELVKKSYSVKGLQPPYSATIIVNHNQIVGEGYTRFLYTKNKKRFRSHAERYAITHAHSNLHGATLYTTLEPCFTFDYPMTFRSCSKLIVDSGIEKVVVGLHPRNLSNSAGIRFLEENGIEVVLFDGGLQHELVLLTDGRASISRRHAPISLRP